MPARRPARRPVRRPTLAARPAAPRHNGKSKVSDTFTFDELCETVGLKPLSRAKGVDYAGYQDYNEGVYENNIDYIAEAGAYAIKRAEAEDEDLSFEDLEEIGMEAERKVGDALFTAYVDAATEAIEDQLVHFDLDLTDVTMKNKPLTYQIRPRTSWKKSLKLLLETINGVGYFTFDSVREFLDSGPYTEREAVLRHLSYLARYGEVYGEISLHREFEANFSNNARRL